MKLMRVIDYIGVGVGAIIVNPEGRVFLAKRGGQAKNERGLWEFPGGSVEFGETLKDALKREMLEEYGITIDVENLLDVVDHILPEEKQHWVSPTFLCKLVGEAEPVIKEPHKCSQIGWFDPVKIDLKLTKISQINLLNYLSLIRNKSRDC